MKKIIAIFIAITIATPTSLVIAQNDDPMLAAIKARKAYMQVIKWNAGPLFGMAKGKVEYNSEQASILATNLQALADMQNSSMWPEGSDNISYEGETRALPEAWTTYPKVAEAHDEFAKASTALASAASSGLDELRDNVGNLGKSCKGCHDDFRAEDN